MRCRRPRLGAARPLVQQLARLLGEVTRLLGGLGCRLLFGAAGVAVDEEVGDKVTGGKVERDRRCSAPDMARHRSVKRIP